MPRGKTKRVFILIDGSNFYHRLKEPEIGLTNLLQFNFNEFAKWLTRGNKIVRKNYYIGVVRAKPNQIKAQRLRRNQQRLFAKLKKQNWEIFRGFIMKTGRDFHEKGVDVKIATDLIVGAYEDTYDTAVLVSSDLDLIPAIDKAKELGKEIEYIGFGHKPSFGLQAHAIDKQL
ncbi:MAG: NYN domain-containing protein [Candidatus Cloacimonetes bacterium]|nr:NYN domain-containing protein [Candidatus Cloacimonadota bacterium]